MYTEVSTIGKNEDFLVFCLITFQTLYSIKHRKKTNDYKCCLVEVLKRPSLLTIVSIVTSYDMCKTPVKQGNNLYLLNYMHVYNISM